MNSYVMAFVVGGVICTLGQLLMDLTKLTPAHVLVGFVVAGAFLGGLGWYQPIIELGGAGATVPLLGFGNVLSTGAIEAVDRSGLLGLFTGSFTAAAAGLTAAVIFGLLMTALFNPRG